MKDTGFHIPVLAEKATQYLITRTDGIYVDCTLGGGGHARHFLETISSQAFLIGIDADAEAVAYAAGQLGQFSNTHLRQAFYDNLDVVLLETGKYPVDGVFFDLGISSFQVDKLHRGFSFQKEAPLDMRFNQQQKLTAAEVVNRYSEEDLGRIIREYGEERRWRAIAREIVLRRAVTPFRTTTDLVEVVKDVVGDDHLNKSLARVFQAIRIEVNQELERLRRALQLAFNALREGGRLVVISYHSLEDRMVKNFMRDKTGRCTCPPDLPECVCGAKQELRLLTRHVVRPDAEEVRANPRSRSARLRAAEKVVPFQQL